MTIYRTDERSPGTQPVQLPPDEMPVLAFVRGSWRPAELRWEHPGHEDTYQAFRYWDDPVDDGQCWEWFDVTHWTVMPPDPEGYERWPSITTTSP